MERFQSDGTPVGKREKKKFGKTLLIILAVVILFGASSTLVVTRQNEYKLIRQFGRVQRILTEPGVRVKIPFVETIEKDKLFERGYRGLRVIKARKTKGQGIGMYLLKQICVSNDVKLQVYTRDMKFFDGDKYCTFGVRLVFDNLIF